MRSRTHKRRSWHAGCRRFWLLASLLASSALLAGCGGTKERPTPKLARADATQLAALARQVARDAATDGCAAVNEIATLQARAHALVTSGRVPVALREPLLRGVARLAGEKPACTPPAPAPVVVAPQDHGNGHGKGHGHGHDKKKHGEGGD